MKTTVIDLLFSAAIIAAHFLALAGSALVAGVFFGLSSVTHFPPFGVFCSVMGLGAFVAACTIALSAFRASTGRAF